VGIIIVGPGAALYVMPEGMSVWHANLLISQETHFPELLSIALVLRSLVTRSRPFSGNSMPICPERLSNQNIHGERFFSASTHTLPCLVHTNQASIPAGPCTPARLVHPQGVLYSSQSTYGLFVAALSIPCVSVRHEGVVPPTTQLRALSSKVFIRELRDLRRMTRTTDLTRALKQKLYHLQITSEFKRLLGTLHRSLETRKRYYRLWNLDKNWPRTAKGFFPVLVRPASSLGAVFIRAFPHLPRCAGCASKNGNSR